MKLKLKLAIAILAACVCPVLSTAQEQAAPKLGWSTSSNNGRFVTCRREIRRPWRPVQYYGCRACDVNNGEQKCRKISGRRAAQIIRSYHSK